MADASVPEREAKETLLVVDDDIRVVELLQITLGGRGYQVLSAYDGETAQKAIETHRPDLVVLDVRLPRKSGFEVLQAVRSDPQLASTPVILISANAATDVRLQGLRLGADDYLTKPFSPRELILRIRRLLDRVQERRALSLRNDVLEDEVKRHRTSLQEMQGDLHRGLNQVGGMLEQVLDLQRAISLDEFLPRFVSTVLAGFEVDRLVLATIEADGRYTPRIWRGLSDLEARPLRLSSRGFVVRLLASVGRPMRVEEFATHPEAEEDIRRLSPAGLTWLVPAVAEDELLGWIGLTVRIEPRSAEVRTLAMLGQGVAAALRNQRAFARARATFISTTAELVAQIEDRYPQLRGHSRRVQALALEFGRRLQLPPEDLDALGDGAILHDLGELESYAELLGGPIQLDRDQREAHRREATRRAQLLLGAHHEGRIGQILRSQHEWWDGSSGPEHLQGPEIPLLARIVALANAWDALIHDRPHRAAYLPSEASGILLSLAGVQFDPELTPLFLLSVLPERESLVVVEAEAGIPRD